MQRKLPSPSNEDLTSSSSSVKNVNSAVCSEDGCPNGVPKLVGTETRKQLVSLPRACHFESAANGQNRVQTMEESFLIRGASQNEPKQEVRVPPFSAHQHCKHVLQGYFQYEVHFVGSLSILKFRKIARLPNAIHVSYLSYFWRHLCTTPFPLLSVAEAVNT